MAMAEQAIAQQEEDYWSSAFLSEPYRLQDRDYEDYAPAYFVGYCGQVQYGGEFSEAERSLCSNWVRIKGDSRLNWEDARPAVMAAWQRAQQCLESEFEFDAYQSAVPVHVSAFAQPMAT